MIKVGSDFSGIGAFDQALKRLNIDYETIFSCDMDKYARQTFIHNYGMPNYYPENVYDREIPTKPLDIYMTSPPCQAFSLAGKRKGEYDKRGILFYNSHEFIKKNNPRYFIFENVKGLLSDDNGKTFARWIDYLGGKSINGNPVIFPHEESVPYHVYHKVLNAKNYGVPQNRERVFIIGIRDDVDNNFSFPKEQPLIKRLKDVLENEVDEKYYLSDALIDYFERHKQDHKDKGNGFAFEPRDVNKPATAISTKAGSRQTDNYIKVKSATSKGYEIARIGEDSINFEHPNSETRRGRVGKSVAQTLTTSCNQGVCIGAIRGRNIDNPKSRESGLPTTQMLEINENGTSNCLTTVQKDNIVVEFNLPGKHEQSSRVYSMNGISPTLTTMQGGGQEPKILNDYRIRKLTPRECFRLMDFPDDFDFSCVSDSQAYKQAGNSIVVNVLAENIKKLNL
ncbi:DNA (cytosine-5-)-methyltransferase [Empedobacter sp.]|uniref:DNA cytosine methyltransferase n=1 Tax=Empedobacter sp. TaxID=1927715 RepID=UPI0028AC7A59|nr:DNA (cytosine-5-)-methyltransferase [Empedobacter sp.]